MKKKVEYITLSQELTRQLISSLHSGTGDREKQELESSLLDLLAGNTNALVIECGTAETYVYEDVIRAPGLAIFRKERKVLKNGEEILLTPKEFDILFFLASNRGEVFTKEQIYYAVWKEGYFLDESNIMAFIRKLRKKVETNPDSPEYIQTVWGIGYKFVE